MGKILIIAGLVLVVVGLLFIMIQKFPWIGKLPGDIYIQRRSVNFYFPITTCILISIILSSILWLVWRK